MDERTQLLTTKIGDVRVHKSVNPKVERGSTVLYERAEGLYDQTIKPSYGTDGLSTQDELRRLLRILEGAHDVFLLPTGLAALTLPLLAVLKAGDEVVMQASGYAPVWRFLNTELKGFGVTVKAFTPDMSVDAIMGLCSPATRLIYVESPASLTMDILDIPAIARAAKARGILTLCDNTYGAGVLLKPLSHGVDMAMQALTKYVGGHSDVLMGSVAVSDAKLAQTLELAIKTYSYFTAADEAWLAIRGLRTLHLRLERSGASALELAQWLEGHDLVTKVRHPGLDSFDTKGLFKRDFTGTNGLFSLELKGAKESAKTEVAVCAFLNALKLFGLGYSWGGYESLAIHYEPQLLMRAALAGQPKPHIEGGHIRLYIGLEAVADLKADLEQALEVYRKAI